MAADTGPEREPSAGQDAAPAAVQGNGTGAAPSAGQDAAPAAVQGNGTGAAPGGPGDAKAQAEGEAETLEQEVLSGVWRAGARALRLVKLTVTVAALFVAVGIVKAFRSQKLLIAAVSLFVVVCLVVVAVVVIGNRGGDAGIPGSEYQPLPTQPDPGPSDYGAGANPSGNPVGGGEGYSHHYAPSDNALLTVVTPSELSRALRLAGPGDVIWVPDGTTITITREFGETLGSGVVLASNRGQDGAAGGRIKWTYSEGDGMAPLLYCESNATVSGLTLEGPVATAGLGSEEGGACIGVRGANGAVSIEIENCDISKFAWAGIYFNDGKLTEETRHWVHHCYIHNCQRHGYGYGIAEEGSAAYLAECNIFRENRHHVMAQAGDTNPNSYELRYNVFYEAVYAFNGNPGGTWYYSHQVDCHGGADSPGCHAGDVLLIHHNTFYENPGKPNVCIRGVPLTGCDVSWNWTVKTGDDAGQGPNSEQWQQLADSMSYQNMTVHDNWYGPDPPPAA